MLTKQDLLAKMAELGACEGATAYVAAQPDSASAEAIWLSCEREDWLCWFAFRLVPVGRFVFACADRAVREYAPKALEAAGFIAEAQTLRSLDPVVSADTALAAARAARAAAAATTDAYAARAAAAAAYDAYAAYAAADDYAAAYDAYAAARAARAAAAAYDAYAAADAAATELKIQLSQLHALWPQIAAAWEG